MSDEKEMKTESLNNFVEYSKKIQEDIDKTRKELSNTFSVGGCKKGFVKITLNVGGYIVQKVEIKPEAMEEPKEVLESCIASAFKDAIEKSEDITRKYIKPLIS